MNHEKGNLLRKENLVDILRIAYEKGEANPSISATELIKEIAKNIKDSRYTITQR